MPEAAEVAVAALQLDAVLRGREVADLTVTHERSTRHADTDAVGAWRGRVDGVRRHGKWLLVDAEAGTLGIHLRMSGQLLVQRTGVPHPDRHVHAVLSVAPGPTGPLAPSPAPAPDPGAPGTTTDGFEVWFRDPRTFGELRLLDDTPGAPDVLDPDVDVADLARRAASRRVGVKAVLLDQQRFVAGIGSYLADEALHCAGIDPRTPAHRLQRSAWQRILAAVRELIATSIQAGGTTLADEGWVDLWGRPGTMADTFAVHARAACGTCGTLTRAAEVGGRRARWCPRCQDPRRRR